MKLRESYLEELNDHLVLQAMTAHIPENTGCTEEEAREAALDKLEEDAKKFVQEGHGIHDYDPSDFEEDEVDSPVGDSDVAMLEPDEDPQHLLEKYFLAQAETEKKNRKYQADVWAKFLSAIQTTAPSLYQVLEFFMIIPNGTAEVERFFKFIKAMKSKTRNRLGAEKARKMMTIAWYLDLTKLDLDVLYEYLKELI